VAFFNTLLVRRRTICGAIPGGATALKLESAEFAQWVREAESIGKSGRWAVTNTRIERLCAKPGAVGPAWVQVFASLAAATFSDYRALKRAYEDPKSDSSLLAWRARNLLELSVWSIYCSHTRENALRVFSDGGRDLLNLFAAFEKWPEIVNKSAIPPVEIGEVEREKEELAARAALQGIESLEGAYMQVSEAAKAIGMGANFSVANRMLSKFAHPTAMQVLAPAGEAEKLALQKQLFFSHGCLFFRGSFDAIEAALIDAAG
jgi:hypothetical protein